MKFTWIWIVAFLCTSCDKSEKPTKSEIRSKHEIRTDPPQDPARTVRNADQASSGPMDSAPAESPLDAITPEVMIAVHQANGIDGIPKEVADGIIQKAGQAGSAEAKMRFITEQSEAWRRIRRHEETAREDPDPMQRMLLEKLFEKHGDAWKDMALELDEQLAASAKVMEFRLKGIPGMSQEESDDLLIRELEKHAPDFKTILSIANQASQR